MRKAVFCLVEDESQAERVVNHLFSSGFSEEDISYLSPDQKRENYVEKDVKKTIKPGSMGTVKHTKAPEGGVTGTVAGGVLGGSLGLLAGIGSLSIPGLGFFIAAGPIMAALSGAGVGGGLGLIIGSLIGSGIPEYEAKRYEAGLKAGNILISVHVDSEEELNRAYEIMKSENAKDVSSTHEKTRAGF